MKSVYLLAVLTVAGAGVHASALAQNDYTITYTYSDLASPERVETLFNRILKVARRHCPTYAVTRDISARPRCVAEVTSDLVHSIDHPDLTLHASGENPSLQIVTVD